MLLFIGLPIISSFFQSLHIEPEQILMEVEKCDPFGCKTETKVDIVATTTFNGKDFPWINGVKMPVAWKKLYGNGKVFFISIGHDPGEFKRYKNGWELLKRGLVWAGS